MSFFDEILGAISDVGEVFLGGGDDNFLGGIVSGIGGGLLDTGINYATDFLADSIFGDPNEEAREANERAAAEQVRAYEGYAQAIREGNAQAMEYYKQIIEMAGPAFNQLRENAAADPYQLNPMQQKQFDESVRYSQNALPFTMKGSGRAQVGAIKEIQQGTRDALYKQNLDTRDEAVRLLSNRGFSAMNDSATSAENATRAAGAVLPDIGDVNASAILASGGIDARETARMTDPLRNSLEAFTSFARDDIKKNAANDRYSRSRETAKAR
jgi:hypothetical protein